MIPIVRVTNCQFAVKLSSQFGICFEPTSHCNMWRRYAKYPAKGYLVWKTFLMIEITFLVDSLHTISLLEI